MGATIFSTSCPLGLPTRSIHRCQGFAGHFMRRRARAKSCELRWTLCSGSTPKDHAFIKFLYLCASHSRKDPLSMRAFISSLRVGALAALGSPRKLSSSILSTPSLDTSKDSKTRRASRGNPSARTVFTNSSFVHRLLPSRSRAPCQTSSSVSKNSWRVAFRALMSSTPSGSSSFKQMNPVRSVSSWGHKLLTSVHPISRQAMANSTNVSRPLPSVSSTRRQAFVTVVNRRLRKARNLSTISASRALDWRCRAATMAACSSTTASCLSPRISSSSAVTLPSPEPSKKRKRALAVMASTSRVAHSALNSWSEQVPLPSGSSLAHTLSTVCRPCSAVASTKTLTMRPASGSSSSRLMEFSPSASKVLKRVFKPLLHPMSRHAVQNSRKFKIPSPLSSRRYQARATDPNVFFRNCRKSSTSIAPSRRCLEGLSSGRSTEEKGVHPPSATGGARRRPPRNVMS
mmetsp:Transcript_51922/g.137322  ORF Transcript_51922/g.137322 Transcript_51922/m.137322 type:complete len:459 (+) Transcript_51922:610-1986(+)